MSAPGEGGMTGAGDTPGSWDEIHHLDEEAFQAQVLSSSVPVLVDFHADWCGPCRWLDPILEELARESDGNYWIGKVDVDEAPELVARFRIGSVPTVVLFQDGQETDRSVGVEPERLRAMVGPEPDERGPAEARPAGGE